MKTTKFDERFFDSTRGRIVKLLRGRTSTVNELADAVGLTDNAVRAHLLSLERDGLVHQSGTQAGARKPHFAYQLTGEAERLFPKAYGELLTRLITVLKDRLSSADVELALRDVGRSLAKDQTAGKPPGDLDSRLATVLRVLEALGGSASVVRRDGAVSIQGSSCPLGAIVEEHPESCRLAETLVAEIVGTPVHEACDRSETPRCRFAIDTPPAR